MNYWEEIFSRHFWWCFCKQTRWRRGHVTMKKWWWWRNLTAILGTVAEHWRNQQSRESFSTVYDFSKALSAATSTLKGNWSTRRNQMEETCRGRFLWIVWMWRSRNCKACPVWLPTAHWPQRHYGKWHHASSRQVQYTILSQEDWFV